jgi:branched-chain amino acid aminotransferase
MQQKYDPRNATIMVWVGDGLRRRDEAKVSVFDSSVQGGDAVWEGLRVYDGKIFCLDRHLDRLFDSAHALAFRNVPDRNRIKHAIFDTLRANGMRDGVHIRLTLTRGEKITSGMDPRLNQGEPCLIVLAEWKPLVYDNTAGIRLVTSSVVRNSPRHLDSKVHHNNLLNNILAKIQANVAGVDAALMLDANGFLAELNDTNIFIARNGALSTPLADACLPGITRGIVMETAQLLSIPTRERDISPTELYTADEAFACGTMGELTPVIEVDGRRIVDKAGMKVLQRVREGFGIAKEKYGEPLPF